MVCGRKRPSALLSKGRGRTTWTACRYRYSQSRCSAITWALRRACAPVLFGTWTRCRGGTAELRIHSGPRIEKTGVVLSSSCSCSAHQHGCDGTVGVLLYLERAGSQLPVRLGERSLVFRSVDQLLEVAGSPTCGTGVDRPGASFPGRTRADRGAPILRTSFTFVYPSLASPASLVGRAAAVWESKRAHNSADSWQYNPSRISCCLQDWS